MGHEEPTSTAVTIDAAIEDLAHHLSRSSPEPLHDQISGMLRNRILSGRWPSHMRLPSEPDLANKLGVARGTIRRATRTLIDAGLLVQHQGRGTFVASQLLEQSFAQEIISTAEALDRDGVTYETRVVRRALEPAAPHIAAHLQLPDTEAQVVALRRVRSVEGTPVFILDNYVVGSLCPGLEGMELTARPLFALLEDEFGLVISSVQRTFQAQAANEEVAALLKVPVGSPVLYLEQTSYEQDTNPIEYSDVWIRGDKLRLSSWLRR